MTASRPCGASGQHPSPATLPTQPARAPRPSSDLDHLEVFLAGAALGAGPVERDILPAGTWRNVFLGQSRLFVVDPAADQAHPASVFHTYAASIDRFKLGHDGTVLPGRCLASRPAA